MKGVLTCIVLLTMACAQAPSRSTAAPWPSTIHLTMTHFSCRLPVLDTRSPGINDAFIDFPSGALIPAGKGGYHYDWAVRRWLPVARREASPDGRRYAIVKDWSANPPSPSRIHIVDAATGEDLRVTAMPDNRTYAVLDFTSMGVTVVPYSESGAEAGAWRMNADTGALTKIADGLYKPPADEWIGVVDPRDPSHQLSHVTGVSVPEPDRIDRRDESGTTSTWIYKPGFWLYWFAFAGSPRLLVEASRVDPATGLSEYEYSLVSSPGRSTQLGGYSGHEPSPYRDLVFVSGLADEHGIWITGTSSEYLVLRDGSIFQVAAHGGVAAGPCG